VLNAAGMAEGEFQASLAPHQTGAARLNLIGVGGATQPLDVLRINAPAGAGSGVAAGTMANWGQTHSQQIAQSRNQRRLLIAGLASVLSIAGVVALVLGADDPRAGPVATGEALPAATAATRPVASEPAAPEPQAPAVAPIPAEPDSAAAIATEPNAIGVHEGDEPDGEPSPSAEPNEAEADPDAAPEDAPQTTAGQARARKAVTRRSQPRASRKPRRVTKPPASSYSVDFKSKFGSRK
jgi:hypothetical protein